MSCALATPSPGYSLTFQSVRVYFHHNDGDLLPCYPLPSAFAEASADPPKFSGKKADEGGLGEGGVKACRAVIDDVRRRVRGHGSQRGFYKAKDTRLDRTVAIKTY